MTSQTEMEVSPDFGAYSDDLVVDINGRQEHITIYHRVVDDAWSEYTAVTDSGTVVSQNRSLRRLLFEEEDLVS